MIIDIGVDTKVRAFAYRAGMFDSGALLETFDLTWHTADPPTVDLPGGGIALPSITSSNVNKLYTAFDDFDAGHISLKTYNGGWNEILTFEGRYPVLRNDHNGLLHIAYIAGVANPDYTDSGTAGMYGDYKIKTYDQKGGVSSPKYFRVR